MSKHWWKGFGVSDLCPARAQVQLLILDCDGVLIDSEPASNRLVAEECRAMGLAITDAQAMHRFAGKALHMIAAELEAEEHVRMPHGWPDRMHKRVLAMLEREAAPIDGAREMLEAVKALGLPLRVASNSSHEEMAVKFRKTGLDGMLQGRLHSARDVGRPKPWPDLFLSAAEAEGVDPQACLVVEDSDTGVLAAHAAGMQCVMLRVEGTSSRQHGPILPKPVFDAAWQAVQPRRIHHLSALRPILLEAMRPDLAL
jgi:HAD superfamily hydrolase (TIGR01509 family)